MIFKDELPLNHEYSFEHLVNAWALDKQEEDEDFRSKRTEDYHQMKAESCSIENCNTLSFRSTDYCWKHQDHIAPESEPEPEAEGNWWEGQQE